MVALFKDIWELDDAKYGITTVQPDRATKKCRIRNLRIDYFMTKIAVIIPTPKACTNCTRQNDCVDDFVDQIVQKYFARHKEAADYFFW